MRGLMLAVLVLVQFTLLPFIHMVNNNKPATFHIAGNTVVYKSN